MKILELNNISKNYGKVQALRNANLTLDHGIYALLGPNGSGKTTVMKIIAGLLKPTEGSITYRGEPIKNNRNYLAHLGYMPQYPAMYPFFSVIEFLLYVAELKGLIDCTGEIEQLLARVELSDVGDRRISALSGGMKQRLSFCGAALGNPEVLILDEPTAGLDPAQRVALRNLISEIGAQKTVLWATHIVSDVENIAREVIFMKRGVATTVPNKGDQTLEARYLTFFGDVL